MTDHQTSPALVHRVYVYADGSLNIDDKTGVLDGAERTAALVRVVRAMVVHDAAVFEDLDVLADLAFGPAGHTTQPPGDRHG